MGFLFFIAVIGVVIYLSTQSSKATKQKWQTAASNLNLVFHEGGFGTSGTISGERCGHRVAVSTFSKGSGNTSKTYTKYRMEYRDRFPLDIRMTRQGALHNLGKVFGLQDIEVGNPLFDDLVIVRGSDPKAVRRFLTPERQEAIRALVAAYADITISNEQVVVNKAGKDMDPGIICHCIRRLESFCNEMADAQRPSSKPKHVTEQPPAIPMVEKTVPPVPEIIEPSFDPFTSANPIVPVVPDVPPPIPEVPEEAAMAEIEPEASVAVEDPVSPEEPVQMPEAPVVDIETVATTLYGGDSGSSLLASKRFEDQFRDRSVTGSGTLKRVSKFSYDPVFTNDTGVKATFDVLEIAGAYSKIKVTAEVRFPPEEYAVLKAKVGQSLPISGTLIAQDTMLNQLYIAED